TPIPGARQTTRVVRRYSGDMANLPAGRATLARAGPSCQPGSGAGAEDHEGIEGSGKPALHALFLSGHGKAGAVQKPPHLGAGDKGIETVERVAGLTGTGLHPDVQDAAGHKRPVERDEM